MRPKNKREREVLELSRILPSLSKAQVEWAGHKVAVGCITASGRSGWCSRCGESFELDGKAVKDGQWVTCPKCGEKSRVRHGKALTWKGGKYAQFLHVLNGWQVIRYIYVSWDCRKGQAQYLHIQQVFQKWCRPGQPTVTVGANLKCFPYLCDNPFSLWGSHSIKVGWYYNEWMRLQTYPRMTLLPVYRKSIPNSRIFAAYDADTLIARIFSCPYLERLYKAGKTAELKDALNHVAGFNRYWPSVRIALRHGFIDTGGWATYFDYLRMLKYLRKDMRSPHYVAPEDFEAMHAEIMRQYRRKIDAREAKRRAAEALRRAEEEERRLREEKRARRSYASRVKKFAGLCIEGDGITVRPLMTIAEFKAEGEAMNHCVFTLGYWRKPSSLVMSARTSDGARLETVEVDIREFRINQCHGVNNLSTARHDDIIALVNARMDTIRSLATPKKKKRLAASRSEVAVM